MLTGIETTCSIGIHDERAAPQRVLVDVEVLLAADKEPEADHIDDALNYDDIRQTVVDIAESRHFDLQETLARVVFDAVRSMKTVTGARVRTINRMSIKMLLKRRISYLICLARPARLLFRRSFPLR